jgi:hypothetical protein
LWEVTIFDYVNRILLVVAGSYLLAWTAQWLLEDFPRLRFCLGLPKKPIVDWSKVPGARLFRLRVAQAGRDSARAASMQAGPMAGNSAQSGHAALSRRLYSDHPAA